jgi:hypothetical protein
VEEAAIKVRRLSRNKLLYPDPKPTFTINNTVMVTTYNPHDNTLKDITKKNWDILGKSTNTTFLHESRLLTAYRRPPNIRDLLVRADVQIKSQRTVIPKHITQAQNPNRDIVSSSSTGDLTQIHNALNSSSFGCLNTKAKKGCTNKKCRYCPILDKSGRITCTTSGVNFTTKYNISCRSTNLIYGITCQTCQKQYVGQTKRKISARFQGHFYSIKTAIEAIENGNRRPAKDAIGLHFSRPDHKVF